MYNSFWNPMRSPFAGVIGTNHAPSIDELLDLKALLVEPQDELDRLQMEISSLLYQKEKVQSYIAAHRAFMTPIRRIPLKYSPNSLSVACQQIEMRFEVWRRHLYFSPWFVGIGDIGNSDVYRRISGIRTWLERSGSLPLSISLHVNWRPNSFLQFSNHDVYDNLKLLIRTLVAFGCRFGNLLLSLSPAGIKTFNDLSTSQFPNLRSFRVRDANIYNKHKRFWDNEEISAHSNVPFASLLTRMPALRRLRIDEIRVRGGGYLALPLRWELLTDLNLQTSNASTTYGLNTIEAFDYSSKNI
ncbi:hypothetical protein J3R30DRAFT_3702066 [Lentinula aciculospora]|uniref:F-box domain-containing protein n=1 Tax=Lentinula aciculospora TaxID=153920 RepID=A0A9W9ABP8_9AGAR|nr:hypothetical protein J3R30DRAFT_3702066 [Lentinula aciculospora]